MEENKTKEYTAKCLVKTNNEGIEHKYEAYYRLDIDGETYTTSGGSFEELQKNVLESANLMLEDKDLQIDLADIEFIDVETKARELAKEIAERSAQTMRLARRNIPEDLVNREIERMTQEYKDDLDSLWN
jgi:hypothetical protein